MNYKRVKCWNFRAKNLDLGFLILHQKSVIFDPFMTHCVSSNYHAIICTALLKEAIDF